MNQPLPSLHTDNESDKNLFSFKTPGNFLPSPLHPPSRKTKQMCHKHVHCAMAVQKLIILKFQCNEIELYHKSNVTSFMDTACTLIQTKKSKCSSDLHLAGKMSLFKKIKSPYFYYNYPVTFKMGQTHKNQHKCVLFDTAYYEVWSILNCTENHWT